MVTGWYLHYFLKGHSPYEWAELIYRCVIASRFLVLFLRFRSSLSLLRSLYTYCIIILFCELCRRQDFDSNESLKHYFQSHLWAVKNRPLIQNGKTLKLYRTKIRWKVALSWLFPKLFYVDSGGSGCDLTPRHCSNPASEGIQKAAVYRLYL